MAVRWMDDMTPERERLLAAVEYERAQVDNRIDDYNAADKSEYPYGEDEWEAVLAARADLGEALTALAAHDRQQGGEG